MKCLLLWQVLGPLLLLFLAGFSDAKKHVNMKVVKAAKVVAEVVPLEKSRGNGKKTTRTTTTSITSTSTAATIASTTSTQMITSTVIITTPPSASTQLTLASVTSTTQSTAPSTTSTTTSTSASIVPLITSTTTALSLSATPTVTSSSLVDYTTSLSLVKTTLFPPDVAISIDEYVTYNTPFTITPSSELMNQPILLSIRCNNSYSLDLLINTSQRTQIDLGTRVKAYDTCDMFTEQNDAFDASNTVSVQVLPARISLTNAGPSELTAGQADIFYTVSTDSNPISVSLSLYCFDSLKASMTVLTSASQQLFPVQRDYYGPCQLRASLADQNYLLPAPIDITVLAPLSFTAPLPGSAFNTSSQITFALSTTNGLMPSVQVSLSCNDGDGGSATGPISGIQLRPNYFGTCTASLSPLAYYNTTATVDISVSRILVIDEPLTEASLVAGSTIVVKVSALHGSPRDTATLTGSCTLGSFSLPNLPINEAVRVELPSNVFGACRIESASADAFYLPSAQQLMYASSELRVLKPSLSTGWSFGASDSNEIAIEALTGTAPSGPVQITCTHATSQNFDSILQVNAGVLRGYEMRGFGACKLSTLFDEKLYVNVRDQPFYAKAPVSLQIDDSLHFGEAVGIRASSPITQSLAFVLQVTCSDGYRNTFQLMTNRDSSIILTDASTTSTCTFSTQENDALIPATELQRSIYARLSLSFGNDVLLAGGQAEFTAETSDALPIAVIIKLSCPGGEVLFEMMTSSGTPQRITIPSTLSGPCQASISASNSQFYLPASCSSTLSINSPISITSPISDASFMAGEKIALWAAAADGTFPEITATLWCADGTEASGSVTGAIKEELYLQPHLSAYGACFITLSTLEPYYDTASARIPVSIYRELRIAAPLSGASMVGGAEYELWIASVDETEDAEVSVHGTCSFGEFTTIIKSNAPQSLNMSTAVHGDCSLSLHTDQPFYRVPTLPVNILVKSRVEILAPLPNSNWIYGKQNTALLHASSARPFSPADGPVEIRCSYRDLDNYAQNFTLTGEELTVPAMDGFGACWMRTWFNESVFVNAERKFFSKASVRLTVTGNTRKLIDRLTKGLFKK